MKVRLLISAALLLAGSAALAQNLNPTVEVTNTYQREASGIEKPAQKLSVPDSLYRFNLDFDYSVRSTPYKGAYEFEPYQVELRPMARPDGQGTLFLRGGIGYNAHPELTVVWTPLRKDHLRLNVYADHQSYLGQYRNIALQNGLFTADGTRYTGCSAQTSAGVNSLFDWTGGQLTADVHYRGTIGSDVRSQAVWGTKTFYHGVGAAVKAASHPESNFLWQAGVQADWLLSPQEHREMQLLGKLSGGTRLGDHFLSLGADVQAVYRADHLAVLVTAIPRYILTLGAFQADLGVKVSYLKGGEAYFYPSKSDFVFPDVRIRYEVLPEALVLHAWATGGDRLDTWQDMIRENPFLAGFQGNMDNAVERINLGGGVRGQLWGRLHYDLKAGYAYYTHGRLWGYTQDTGVSGDWTPAYGYAAYGQFAALAQLGWRSEYLDVDGSIRYNRSWLPEDGLLFASSLSAGAIYAFSPAAVEGKLRALYNWGGRFWGGVDVEGQSDRVAPVTGVALPGYVDLGLYGEVRMNRQLGFWLRLGNLLNQTVQRTPFHAENGIYFTLGARWNF